MTAGAQDLPIVIAGAGLGGLCAALALSQRGCPVRLLERTDQLKEIGAGIQLGPNVFRVLERLGIAEHVSRRAVFPDQLVMMDSISGEVITALPVEGQFRNRFCYPYALIHRADLHQALLDHCLRCPLVTIQTSQKLVDFQDWGDRVTVYVDGGGTYEGAALVGADGIASTVRARLLNDGPPRRSGHIAYRAVLPAEDMPAHLRVNKMTLWAGPRNHLVHYPLRGHQLYNLVAAFHSDRDVEGWNTQGDPEELYRHFELVVSDVKSMLNKISTWRMWVLCDRDPTREWSKGRVTLLGDSAHPMLQYLGQGAGMAIEDAFVLAEEVEVAQGDYARAFEAYQDRRYLRAGRAQLTSRLYGEFFHAAGASREIRNRFIASRTEDEAREGLAWLYDGPDFLQPASMETSPCPVP